MIELRSSRYCQNCPDFDVVVTKVVLENGVRTIIGCKKEKFCKDKVAYLKDRVRESFCSGCPD